MLALPGIASAAAAGTTPVHYPATIATATVSSAAFVTAAAGSAELRIAHVCVGIGFCDVPDLAPTSPLGGVDRERRGKLGHGHPYNVAACYSSLSAPLFVS